MVDINIVNEKIKHIAFIMDGNGRWALKQGKPREYGHKFGVEAFKRVVKHCQKIGIKAITVYIFSTENWTRPEREINIIMTLFREALNDALANLVSNDVCLNFIGDRAIFVNQSNVLELMQRLETESRGNSTILNLAVNYGGRAEIVNAVNLLLKEGYTAVTEKDIESKLYTLDSPALDLIVRTGAEKRLSNFLTWQSVYSELYFTDILWPDFSAAGVDMAVEDFLKRKRRFGGV